MAAYNLKYSAGTYQRKINALNGYYSQLNTHLEQLETYREQMKNFWDGTDSSQEYYNHIGEKIREVKKAMEDCKITNLKYQEIVEDLKNASGQVDNVVADIKEATKEVVDVAADAAKIAGMIM